MPDQKLTALSAFTPVATDIIYGVDDPGGSPASGKLTLQSVFDLFETIDFTQTQKISSTSSTSWVIDRDTSTNGATIGTVLWTARDDGGATQSYAAIRGVLDNSAATVEDGLIEFVTWQDGSFNTRATMNVGMFLQGATGGDQGVGTINAQKLFDDGVSVCFAIEEALTGTYDPIEWRQAAPYSAIDAYEALKARGRNPASADDYAAEVAAHQGIPGYWNKAEWTARTANEQRVSLAERHERALLALDLMALAVRDLTRRVKALEQA